MRRLISLDTRMTSLSLYSSCNASAVERIWLSGLMPGRLSGSRFFNASVWKKTWPHRFSWSSLPFFTQGRGRPLAISSRVAQVINSSKKRLTWRTFRATSDMPFLPLSSSSRTTMGKKILCSAKRKMEVGSCMRTLVSSTYIRGLL